MVKKIINDPPTLKQKKFVEAYVKMEVMPLKLP